jgi:chromosome segregation ATPase
LTYSKSKIDTLQLDFDLLTSQFEKSQRQVSSLEAQLEDRTQEATESESSAVQLRRENGEMKAALDELRSKVVSLTDEKMRTEESIGELSSRERKLQSEKESLEHQLSSVREELDRAKKLLTEERNADRLEVENMKNELEYWKKAWPHSPKELETYVEDRNEQLAKIEGLLAARRESDEKLNADISRLLEVRENVSEMEERLKSLEEKYMPSATINGSAN